jgi:6-phosphogluconolactonase/glucosamine-6-phosphate isomerase/deaminase
MEVIKTATPKEVAGKALSELLLEHEAKPILLMLSAGSALSILDFVPVSGFAPHLTITVLDERYSTDKKVNNFAQLEATNFYNTALRAGVNFISTIVQEGESLDGLRLRFETALRTWKEKYKEGVVIATMGIGADGHTAGIFSGGYGVDFDGEAWVAGYSVPSTVHEYTDRVTVTKTFLRQEVTSAVVFAVGEEKKPHIQKILDGTCVLENLPSCVIREMREVKLVTD